jgi:heat shock protein HslJ
LNKYGGDLLKNKNSVYLLLGVLAVIVILAVLFLASCSRGGGDSSAPTNTAAPTNTPKPSPTSAPTNTPKPSATNVPANTPNPIQNIIWQWVSLTDQSMGETTSVPNPADYTISFYPDGTLSGKADCNTFTGTYSQQNGFSIKLGATTGAACSEASLEQQYLNLLSNVAAGGSDGAGGLALETAGGEQRMLFKNGGGTVKP